MHNIKFNLMRGLAGDRYADAVIAHAEHRAQLTGPGDIEGLPERMQDSGAGSEHVRQSTSFRPTVDQLRHDCKTIAEVAEPTDTISNLVEKTGLARSSVGRRIQMMERELGLDPTAPAERAHARFGARPDRRAGSIARTWRRHCL